MSEHPTFDRKKGFVALPVEVLDIDLSPGAFRTLVELCRMANIDGFCWPSLSQLSERLGRSRSSISGYLKDLRDENLIETQEQRTANGYNYRLKYRVTFWQDWRTSLTGKTVQKPERSVQHTERLKESKKQIHINHCADAEFSNMQGLLDGWARCFKGAPYPTVSQLPNRELVAKTLDQINAASCFAPIMSADIRERLSATFSGLGVCNTAADLEALTVFLLKKKFNDVELDDYLIRLRKVWPAHWRNAPSVAQLEKLMKGKEIHSIGSMTELLKSYLKRWRLAENTLQSRSWSGSLSRNDTVQSENA